MPERIVDFGVLQRMALRIGQHVDPLHAAHGEAFVRVLFVENPIRSFRAGAQITLGRAPLLVQHAFHLGLKSAAQDLAEQQCRATPAGC